MSNIIKTRLLGKNVGIVVTPFTKAADGSVSFGSAHTVTGLAGRATISRKWETERTDSDDADSADRDWTKTDWQLNVEQVKTTYGAGNDLEDVIDGNGGQPYLRVVITTPQGVLTKTRTYYGIISEDSWDKEVGKNSDRLTIDKMTMYDNVGAEIANPTVVVA